MSFKLSQTSPYPVVQVDKQLTKVSFPPEFYKAFSLGQTRLLASLLWIDVLMDADASHYKFDDFNSWMYLRFKTIADLDPLFYENYLYGALYLSIIKDDDLGAKEIYDRGLKHFPEDLELLKNAAFHYRFELHDYKMAQELYEKVAKNPSSPPLFKRMLARLRTHNEDLEGALILLQEMYMKAPDESELKKRLHESLYSLKAQIDLKCLNEGSNSNCLKIDAEGNPYFKDESGRFRARKDFQTYDLNETRSKKKGGL